ncbi:MAG: pitrilysin family protein [Gemmatimonadales bacterium]|nr:pitrilysin family protein [Gemmatimonadales bacterium]
MPPRWTAGVHREVLPNGLTLLVQADPSAPAVAVVTHVRAGFFDEPDAVQGISHVLEHMYFKGTARRGPGALARETKAAGGYLNASTSYDRTSYFVVLPASGLATALDLQADALMHCALDADELRRELQVIIQEAKRKLDTPSAVCHETLHEVMFDHHRIRRWRIGTEAGLAAMTRDDLWTYYRSRYVPERTIVSIVGDVDVAEAAALAREAYGGWEARPGSADASPAEPPRAEVRARTLRGEVAKADLAIGWRAVPPSHADSAPLDLAAAVLASGRGSWLQRAVRESGLASSIGAWHYQPSELGVFSVGAELEPARLPDVLAAVAAATRRLAEAGPTADDLARARTLLLARWARGMEATEGRASSLANAEAMGGLHLLEEEFAALERTTAEEIRDAAARWLRPEAVCAVAYVPAAAAHGVDATALADLFAAAGAGGRTGGRAEGSSAGAAISPASRPPVRGSARPPRAPTRVLTLALPGADIVVRPKRGVPLVALGAYIPRAHPEPAEWAGLAALATRSAVRGANGRDAAALAFAFEGLGGTLAPSVGLDWIGFGTSVLSEHLGEAAHLLADVIAAPHHEASSVETERGLMRQEALQVADDMFRHPFQLAFRAAFGDEGYGLPASGLPDTLAGIPLTAVADWHRGAWRAARPLVVAVGDLDPDGAREALAAAFGSFPAAEAAPPPPPQLYAITDHPVTREAERQKAQSAFAMVFMGPDRRAPERWAAEVWAAVAGGLGGRLFEALRDQRSLAYSVVASTWQKRRAGALLTYIATAPEREAEAREAMLIELGRFARERVTEAELDRARNYLAGQAEVSRQSASSVLAEIVDAWIAGEGLQELDDPGAPYRAVTAMDVLAVARAALAPERRAEGVVRGTGGGR